METAGRARSRRRRTTKLLLLASGRDEFVGEGIEW